MQALRSELNMAEHIKVGRTDAHGSCGSKETLQTPLWLPRRFRRALVYCRGAYQARNRRLNRFMTGLAALLLCHKVYGSVLEVKRKF